MKNGGLQDAIDAAAKSFFGRTLKEAKARNICVVCGCRTYGFRDQESIREYEISGLCQKCQDKTFGQ